MKYWVLINKADPNGYAVVGSSRKPKNAICPAPEGATASDGKYISVADVPVDGGLEGQTIKVATLDQAQKDADEAAKETAKAAIQYKEDRQAAYPPIGDQLDAIYKKEALGDSTEWDAIAAQIAQVKLDYPKPE